MTPPTNSLKTDWRRTSLTSLIPAVLLLSTSCAITETGFEPRPQVNENMVVLSVDAVEYYGYVELTEATSELSPPAHLLRFQAYTPEGPFDVNGFAYQGQNVVSGIMRMEDPLVQSIEGGATFAYSAPEDQTPIASNTQHLLRLTEDGGDDFAVTQIVLELRNADMAISGTVSGVVIAHTDHGDLESTVVSDGAVVDFSFAGDSVTVLCNEGVESLELKPDVQFACTRWSDSVDCSELGGEPNVSCPPSP